MKIIYKKYGQAFHDLRVQKNISLSYFEKQGIATKSSLSNFENGKSMLSFSVLDEALQALQVSLFDYSLVVNNGNLDDFQEVFLNLEEAYFQRNRKVLQNVYQEYKTEGELWELVALSAKASYTSLTQREKKTVEKFLKGIQVWGIFELYVLNNTIFQIDKSLLYRIFNDFWQINQDYNKVQSYRVLVLRTLFKGCLRFIDEEDKVIVQLNLERSREILHPTDIFNRVLISFIEGYFSYKFIDVLKGKKQMKQTLKYLKSIQAMEIYNTLKWYYDTRISE
ncbi:MAG: helix-turn-helix domain-containing protein [Streptococcaceae bacterium]|nr:helix-turn-helix domain-containing protein [Streptococcaceae bacterium]